MNKKILYMAPVAVFVGSIASLVSIQLVSVYRLPAVVAIIPVGVVLFLLFAIGRQIDRNNK